MPAYSDDEPSRPRRRSRRPEYYEPESDTEQDYSYPTPKPRRIRQSRPSKREEQSAPPTRRPSILRDPDETASQRESRRPRSHSNVRLRTPGSDSDSVAQDPHHRPRKPSRRSTKSRIDLEDKDGPEYKQFRDKRDGYESEEGEMLRNARKLGRPRDDDYDDDLMDDKRSRRPRDSRNSRPDREARRERDLRSDRGPRPDRPSRDARGAREPRGPSPDREPSRREKPRAPRDFGAESSAGPAAAGAAAGAAIGNNPRLKTRRIYKDHPRHRQGYDDNDDDGDGDDEPPPRRRPLSRDSDDRHGDPRRSAPEMGGYRSDAAPPRRRDRRRDDDGSDSYDRKRRGDGDRSGGSRTRDARPPRPQDYYSDHRDDRARRSDPRDRRPRNSARESYREDDRYRDYDRRRGDGDEGRAAKTPKKGGFGGFASLGGLGNLGKFDFKDSAWQKEATAAFMTYALPVIKKEGSKYARREMQKYMERQGGGGGRR